MMSSFVAVEPRTGTSGTTGLPTYGAATTYRAHIERKVRLVRNDKGQEVVSGSRAYLMSNVALEPTVRATLTTADAGSTMPHAIQPPIVAVERRFDQRGPHHTVLHFA
jgi:hypothetical protein